MSAEIKKEIQLEIAHVLFIDIVGYSKLSINEQHAAVEELNQVDRTSEQFPNERNIRALDYNCHLIVLWLLGLLGHVGGSLIHLLLEHCSNVILQP